MIFQNNVQTTKTVYFKYLMELFAIH